MHEPRIITDELGKMGQERNDVVLYFSLDRIDLRDIEFCAAAFFPDGLRGRFRNDAKLRQRISCMRLDFKPDAKLGFR